MSQKFVFQVDNNRVQAYLSDNTSFRPLGSPHHFVTPLSDDDLNELRWYLEEYPVTALRAERYRATLVEAQLPTWGSALFHAILPPLSEAKAAWSALSDQSVELWISSHSPYYLGLPWELLREEVDAPLIVDSCRGLQRCIQPPHEFESDVFPNTIHVLLVISRPAGTPDVDYHLFAGALYEQLRLAPERLQVEVLRPPTFDALELRLRRAQQEGKPFDILHFDGHGSFREEETGTPVAELVFETTRGVAHSVRAHQLTERLSGIKIPLVVLAACHSGTTSHGIAAESALAPTLLESGIVSSVIALSYAFSSDAVRLFFSQFYSSLVRGNSIKEAVSVGRETLRDNTKRRSSRAEVALQDWIVPVHYAVRVSRSSQIESPSIDACMTLSTEQLVGRDADFHAMEQIARSHRVIAICGPVGIGKSMFAQQFLAWFAETGGDSSCSGTWSFDIRTIKSYQELAQAVASVSHEGSQTSLQALEDLFRTFPSVVVLENIDAIADWSQNDAELLGAALSGLNASHKGLVLLTGWHLPVQLEGIMVHTLNRLTTEAAVELIRMRRGSMPTQSSGNALAMLAELLDGHPDCLHSAGNTGEDELGWPVPLIRESARHRAQEVFVKLTDSDQDHLMLLAPADTFVDLQLLKHLTGYFERESEQPRRSKLPARFQAQVFEEWQGVMERCCVAGLAYHVKGAIFKVHPSLPSLARERWERLSGDEFAAEWIHLTSTYDRCYLALAFQLSFKLSLGTGLSDHPLPAEMQDIDPEYIGYQLQGHVRRIKLAMIRAVERDDLTPACLAADFLMAAWKHEERSEIEFCKRLLRALDSRASGNLSMDGAEGTLRLFVLEVLARVINAAERLEVEGQLRRILPILAERSDEHGRMRYASSCLLLGTYLDYGGRPKEAESFVRTAISVFDALGDEHNSARAKNSLGIVLERQGLMFTGMEMAQKAQADYFAARPEDLVEKNNRLAIAAFDRGELDKAIEFQLENIADAKNNPRLKARAMHELGLIEDSRNNLREAEKWYRQALALKEQLGEPTVEATTLMSLGENAMARGEPQEAEDWFARVVNLGADPVIVARSEICLSDLYKKRGDLKAALSHLIRGLRGFLGEPKLELGVVYQCTASIVEDVGVEAFEEGWQTITGAVLADNERLMIAEMLVEADAKATASMLVQPLTTNKASIVVARAQLIIAKQRIDARGTDENKADLGEAKHALEKAIQLLEALPRDVDAEAAFGKALHILGAIECTNNGPSSGVRLLEQSVIALREAQKNSGVADKVGLSNVLSTLALARYRLGQIPAAVEALRESVRILEDCHQISQAYRPSLTSESYQLATYLFQAAEYEESLAVAARVKSLLELGPERERFASSPRFGEVIQFISECLFRLKRQDEVLPLLMKHVDVVKKFAADSNPEVHHEYLVWSLNIASLLHRAGRDLEARHWFNEVAEASANWMLFGPHSASVAIDLANMISELKQSGDDSAIQALRSVLDTLIAKVPDRAECLIAEVQVDFDLSARKPLSVEELEFLATRFRPLISDAVATKLFRMRFAFLAAGLVAIWCEGGELKKALGLAEEVQGLINKYKEQELIDLLAGSRRNLCITLAKASDWGMAVEQQKALFRLSEMASASSKVIELCSEVSADLLDRMAETSKFETGVNVLLEMMEAAFSQRTDELIQGIFTGTNNFLIRCAIPLEKAEALIERVSKLRSKFPGEDVLKRVEAVCMWRLAEAQLKSEEPQKAKTSCEVLLKMAESEASYVPFGVLLAESVCRSLAVAGQVADAETIFAKTAQLLSRTEYMEELCKIVASIGNGLIEVIHRSEIERDTSGILGSLDELGAAHPTDESIAKVRALYLVNSVGAIRDSQEFATAYQQFITIRNQHKGSTAIQELWGLGVQNFVAGTINSGSLDLAQQIFNELLKEAQSGSSGALGTGIVGAAANLMRGYIYYEQVPRAISVLEAFLQCQILPKQRGALAPVIEASGRLASAIRHYEDQEKRLKFGSLARMLLSLPGSNDVSSDVKTSSLYEDLMNMSKTRVTWMRKVLDLISRRYSKSGRV